MPQLIDYSWIIIGIILLAILTGVVFLLLVFLIFINTSYRSPFKKRTRECTRKKDETQMRMFLEGVDWAQQFKDKTERLCIENDGLKLYGEYINLGFKKCAVILQGRSESLLYSYYYADVYAKNEHNILVVDLRSYGFSDGKYQTGGIKESDDVVLWIKLINEKYNINYFTIHGICIGGATAIYTYCKLKKEGSSLVKKIVTDGIYKNYFELYKAHFKVLKAPVLPIIADCSIYTVFFLLFLITKVKLLKETPINSMKNIDIPILFIWSTMDNFSPKLNCNELFESCASEQKEIYYFTKGRHSHVRSAQKVEYDELIANFLQK